MSYQNSMNAILAAGFALGDSINKNVQAKEQKKAATELEKSNLNKTIKDADSELESSDKEIEAMAVENPITKETSNGKTELLTNPDEYLKADKERNELDYENALTNAKFEAENPNGSGVDSAEYKRYAQDLQKAQKALATVNEKIKAREKLKFDRETAINRLNELGGKR